MNEWRRSRKRSHRAGESILAAAISACALFAGCDGKTSAEKLREAGFDPAARAVSFDVIADRLNNLSQAVKAHDEASEAADVIVDATRSTDSQPVLGVVTDGPNRSGVFAFLHVPQGNVNFLSLGVQPDDTIEYLVEVPKAGNIAELEFFKKARLDGRKSIPAYVAKVIDAHTLLLKNQFSPLAEGESYPLAPIVITRPNRVRIDRLERAIADWEATGVPATDWEATPDRDALDALVVQLNQWIERDETSVAWREDSLIRQLPDAERAQFGDLAAERFVRSDARLLQEAVWLRNIARRADPAGDPLERAKLAFDWIIDNVQLDDGQAALGIRQRPWQALVSGRGTADERAWLFVHVLRQLNIDAVALAIPPEEGRQPVGSPRVWAVAVRAGEDWRLFDPALGLPIPAADGARVATLSGAKADDAILRQLDLDGSHTYPIAAQQISRAVALVEATPFYLSRRMRRIEVQLAGADRIVLSTSPSRIADAIRSHVASVGVWRIGAETVAAQDGLSASARSVLAEQFRTFARVPALWKGRVLQFRRDDHRLELDYADRPQRVYSPQLDPRYYFTRFCRKADRDFSESNANRFPVESFRLAKHFATVWMGCVSREDGDQTEALAYFGERTLDREHDALLLPLARHNLARTHERIASLLDNLTSVDDGSPSDTPGDWIPSPRRVLVLALAEAAAAQRVAAIATYEADDSLQRRGSLLRARQLATRDTDASAAARSPANGGPAAASR